MLSSFRIAPSKLFMNLLCNLNLNFCFFMILAMSLRTFFPKVDFFIVLWSFTWYWNWLWLWCGDKSWNWFWYWSWCWISLGNSFFTGFYVGMSLWICLGVGFFCWNQSSNQLWCCSWFWTSSHFCGVAFISDLWIRKWFNFFSCCNWC